MADITWPADFLPSEFEFGLRSNVLIAVSGYNGGTTTSEIPGARWVARVTMPVNTDEQGVQPVAEAFAASLRGMANRLVMGHLKRREPRGTGRGTMTSSGAARGALFMSISGTGTLLRGDMIGVTTTSGPQLLMVTADANVGGPVNFSPPLRAPVDAGSAVVWNYPTTRWIMTASELMVQYGTNQTNQGIILDLMEVWA